MQRRHRISGTNQHAEIRQQGTSAANRLLVIRYLPNDLEYSRFAFVVSRRLGNAVTRNRIRRRLKESIRGLKPGPGWDAVFIARVGAQRATFDELRRAAIGLLRRSRIAFSGLPNATPAAEGTKKGGK